MSNWWNDHASVMQLSKSADLPIVYKQHGWDGLNTDRCILFPHWNLRVVQLDYSVLPFFIPCSNGFPWPSTWCLSNLAARHNCLRGTYALGKCSFLYRYLVGCTVWRGNAYRHVKVEGEGHTSWTGNTMVRFMQSGISFLFTGLIVTSRWQQGLDSIDRRMDSRTIKIKGDG